MNDLSQILRISGQIAGIGGLSLVVLMILFREVIRKNVFSRLSPRDSYRLFRLVVILVFAVALTGLGAWTAVECRNWLTGVGAQPRKTSSRFERDFPVKLGDSRPLVRKRLGAPQERYVVWDSFYSEGINVYYDRHDHTVDGFDMGRLASGVSYDGTVCGVRLGDSFAVAKQTLGRPHSWGLPDSARSLAVWERGGCRLIATVSSEGANAGTIASITYCRNNSFANYIPIIAATLIELKDGRPLSFAEEEGDPFMALLKADDPCFKKPSHIVDASLAEIGGAFIVVQFEESKTVLFYIYPVEWIDPRLRMVVELDEAGEPKFPGRNVTNEASPIDDKFIRAIITVETEHDTRE